MATELAIIFALVLANGLFSGAEIAIVTLRRTRLQALVDEGKRAALAVAELRAKPERFLATVQVGITVLGAAASAYGGDRLADRMSPAIARVPLLVDWAHEIALGIVVVVVAYLSLIVGELVPKSLALRSPERYALLVGRPLLGLAQIARPIVWFLTASSNVVLKIFGDRTSFTEARMSPDELKAMLEEAGEGGTIDPRASEIAARAIELTELVAADVMVPRTVIVGIHEGASEEEVRRVFKESGHSRLPVYRSAPEDVIGYVSVRDVYAKDAQPWRELMRPAMFLPETMKAIDVLADLQTRATHMAIVVDEHGVTVGLLTREDLVEEVLGEMLSEHREPRLGHGLVRQPDGSVLVSGLASVRDVNRVLDIELPEEGDWTTIGGLLVALAGRIPETGTELAVTGVKLVVAEASPRRVRAVRITKVRGEVSAPA